MECLKLCFLLIHVTATGPHSQAIKANGFVFLSAQFPGDREGKLISGGVKQQAERMIENTKIVLEQAGSGLEGIVKVNVSIYTSKSCEVESEDRVEREFLLMM